MIQMILNLIVLGGAGAADGRRQAWPRGQDNGCRDWSPAADA